MHARIVAPAMALFMLAAGGCQRAPESQRVELPRITRNGPPAAFATLALARPAMERANLSGAGEERVAASAPARSGTGFRLPSELDLAPPDTGSAPRAMLIHMGEATILVDSVVPAMDRLRRLAEGLGGLLGATSMRDEGGGRRSSDLEAKVPASRFDQLLAGLRLLGRVEALQVRVEDAGEDFVDVTARLRNARRLEGRVLSILDARTGKVADLIAAERELARVREDIERYEGHVRFLRSRTALSTLTVTLHEAPTVAGRPGDQGMVVEALSQAWRNFLFLIAFLIQASGVIVPLAAVAAVAWGIKSRLGGGGAAPTRLSLGNPSA
jgi:hypothetical protein